MKMYASRTGTRRNLAALRAHGWSLIVSATGVHRSEGMPYAIDNGAWTAYQKGRPFDHGLFRAVLALLGQGADWVALPDVVGDARATATTTWRWLAEVGSEHRCLAVIQDGAHEQVMEALSPHVFGYFLGGTTTYKINNIQRWGDWCRSHGMYYHVGRVNTANRIAACAAAGAHSVDGTSASRYSVNTPRLTRARDDAMVGRTDPMLRHAATEAVSAKGK